jgi:hypothetical protein
MDAATIRYDASLVEEAVFLAVARSSQAAGREFHARRALLYEHGDLDEREARFEAFAAEWFTRLALDRPLHEALRERSALLRQVACVRVLPARSRRDELADLATGAAPPSLPALLVRLTPASLADDLRLLPWLRRELLHVADMLDPAYGYQPDLPAPEQGAVLDGLLRNRYRVVWGATVAGRLAREERAEPSLRERARDEFADAFPQLGAQLDAAFDRWFGEGAPSHAAIADFVREPRPPREPGRT